MSNAGSRPLRKHTRRQESLSKCRSLPSLQFTEATVEFICPNCGLSSSLIPICLRCYQTTSNLEDKPPPALPRRVSWTIISTLSAGQETPHGRHVADESPTLSRTSISTTKTSAPTESDSEFCQRRQVMGPVLTHNGSTSKALSPQRDGVVLTSSQLSLSLPEDQLFISQSLTPPVADEDAGLGKEFSHNEARRDCGRCDDHNTLTNHSTASHRDEDDTNPSVSMARSNRRSKQHPDVSSLKLGAGSSSSRSSLASSLHRSRLRSRSLFSLTNSVSSVHSKPTQPTNTNSTSTTATMINAAKAMSRRISSTTLRTIDPSASHTHHRVSEQLTEHESADEKYGPLDSGDNTNHSRTLRRRRRLGNPPNAAPTQPLNSLRKRVSAVALNSQPIAVSFMLNRRPPTPESDTSMHSPLMIPVDGDGDAAKASVMKAPPATGNADKGKGVDGLVDNGAEFDHTAAPISRTSTLLPDVPVDLSRLSDEVGAPTSSDSQATSSPQPLGSNTQTMHILPSTGPTSPARIGHPSRPYYSAIRKHCMSSPAAVAPTSRPTSFGQTLSAGASPTNSRPTSSIIGGKPLLPSSFAVHAGVMTPLARSRPLSMGSVPVSGPAITAVIASHSHKNSVESSIGTHGMSVFDLEHEVDMSQDDVSGAPSSFQMGLSGGGRKATSLSRAFGLGHKEKKRRTWASGLFSDDEGTAPPSSYALKKRDGKRRSSSGALPAMNIDRFGSSMSGETELKMSLALMAQEDEAQRLHFRQQSAGAAQVDATHHHRFRFRHTMDFHQHQHQQQQQQQRASPSDIADAHDSAAHPSACVPGSGLGVLARKLKKGFLKGFSHSNTNTTATAP